jgi:hypothetical protein
MSITISATPDKNAYQYGDTATVTYTVASEAVTLNGVSMVLSFNDESLLLDSYTFNFEWDFTQPDVTVTNGVCYMFFDGVMMAPVEFAVGTVLYTLCFKSKIRTKHTTQVVAENSLALAVYEEEPVAVVTATCTLAFIPEDTDETVVKQTKLGWMGYRKCPICGVRIMVEPSCWWVHMQFEHNGQRNYMIPSGAWADQPGWKDPKNGWGYAWHHKCYACGDTFVDAEGLLSHLATWHLCNTA